MKQSGDVFFDTVMKLCGVEHSPFCLTRYLSLPHHLLEDLPYINGFMLTLFQ